MAVSVIPVVSWDPSWQWDNQLSIKEGQVSYGQLMGVCEVAILPAEFFDLPSSPF